MRRCRPSSPYEQYYETAPQIYVQTALSDIQLAGETFLFRSDRDKDHFMRNCKASLSIPSPSVDSSAYVRILKIR